MSFEYEDFDEADQAIMAYFHPEEEEDTADYAAEDLAVVDHQLVKGNDYLIKLYETGMMKSVHMELQENAKIPNLSISINRSHSDAATTKTTTTTTKIAASSPPTAEKFLKSSQRLVFFVLFFFLSSSSSSIFITLFSQ